MIVKVQMRAFCKDGTYREVEIPEDGKQVTLSQLLDLVYKYGQNDFQPKQCPSVSVGDVIEIGDGLFVVCAAGFHRFTPEEFANYVALPRLDRSFACYDFKPDA